MNNTKRIEKKESKAGGSDDVRESEGEWYQYRQNDYMTIAVWQNMNLMTNIL
jgi:hypothetical protein